MRKAMKKPFFVLCVIGRSGSGKGTQVEMLQNKIKGLVHITTSDLLKKFIKRGGLFAKRVDQEMKQGHAVPSSLAIELWMDVLLDLSKNARGVVWEGSPRTLLEAEVMDDAVPFTTGVQPVPVYIDISDAEAKKRLLKRLVCVKCKEVVPYKLLDSHPKTCSFCGGALIRRLDDNPKSILERLRYFRRLVVPALVWYQKQKRLIVINGEQPADAVFKDFWAALKRRKLV